MLVLKKLTLAPIFLLVFALTVYQLIPFLKSYDLVFSLSLATLFQLIFLSALILISSFLFVLFATFARDLKFVLPVGILASLIPMIFMDPSLGIVFMVGIIISLILTFLGLESSLKSYLNFNPSSLLGPSIRHLCSFFILIICIIFFLSINKIIQENGFQVPDSLIDTAIKFAGPQAENNQSETLPKLNQEQIELLKKNPDLLKQYGLDPKILDTLNSPKTQNISNDFIKQTVQSQLQNIIKPYLAFIPAVLAAILFLTLQSVVSVLTLFIYPLLWLIFYILEKSGFIKFSEEMRPVKKLVI